MYCVLVANTRSNLVPFSIREDLARTPCALDGPVKGLLDEGDVGELPGRVVNAVGAGGGGVRPAENVGQIISRGARGVACNLQEELNEVVGMK